jgi:type I restriction enzyme M protein
MPADLVAIENRLWAAADQLWANTGLKPAEFSTPVLGLIFALRRQALRRGQTAAGRQRHPARRCARPWTTRPKAVLYLPLQARFSHLLRLTEGANLGRATATAMELMEAHNPELHGVLPHGYNLLPNTTLVELLRLLAPLDMEGDAFGKVYEYFLGNFALKEGQKGGVFYTPTSIVRLIVEVLQPFHGRIFDPACGSGGMFVQSAAFVQCHSRADRVWHRKSRRHRQARQDEPGRARSVRRRPRGTRR